MADQDKSGAKPHNLIRGVASLEDNLEQVSQAIVECFQVARIIPRDMDEYGHMRQAEIGNAVRLLRASAKIGRTLALIQGSKFDHNISVTRKLTASPAPKRPRVQTITQEIQEDTKPPPPQISEGSNDA